MFESFAQCESVVLSASANSTSICSGGSLNLGSSITGVTGNPNITYTWTGPNGFTFSGADPLAFNVAAAAEGTYTLTANIAGCNAPITSTVFVDVLPLPAVPSFNLPATGCPGVSIPVSGFSPVSGVTYNWTFSDSDGHIVNGSSNNPSALFESGGSYAVSVTATFASSGCTVTSATDNINITDVSVFPPDIALNGVYLDTVVFNNVITYQVCDGTASGTVDISNYTGTNNPATTYTFQWGNSTAVNFNTNITQPVSIGDNSLIVSATYNGCTVSESMNVYIGSNPFVSVGVGSSINLCPGASVTASITPVDNGQQNSPGTTYDLYFSNNPNTIIQSFTDLTAVTAASPFTFNQSSCGAGATNACFPSQPNVFYAYVVATNACNTSCASSPAITYNSAPDANFSLSATTVCVNSNVTLSNTGTTGNTTTGNATSGFQCTASSKIKYTITPSTYTVVSGNLGGTSPNYNNWNGSNSVVLSFSEPGTYEITQNAQANSCGADAIIQTICVEAPPAPNFTASPLEGCTPLNVDVTNLSPLSGCSMTTLWTSIQTATGCNPQPGAPTITSPNLLEPTVVFEEPGTYTLRLSMTNTCGTITDEVPNIQVNSKPVVTVSLTPTICAGNNVTPTATYQDCGSPILSNGWTFTGGNPSSSDQQDPGQVTYNTPGNYTVTATAMNECGTTSTPASLTVHAIPTADAGVNTTICSGSQTTLNGSATGGSTNYTYAWTPIAAPTNNTTEDVQVSPNATTTYTLTVQDSFGCSDSDNVQITVNQAASANVPDFITCVDIPVEVNASANGPGYWSVTPSGNGSFLDINENITEYTPPSGATGTITITWTTNDPDGSGANNPCPLVQEAGVVTIVSPPQASFANDFEVCSSGTVNLNVTTNVTGSWTASPDNLGSIVNSNSASATYTPFSNSTGTVNLTWTTIDPSGPCAAVAADTTLIIFPAATANAGGPYVTCGTDSVAVQATANGPGSWSVLPAGAGLFTQPTSASTFFTPSNPSAANITLKWTTSDPDNFTGGGNGPCGPVESTASLQVFAPPVANVTDETACGGLPVSIQAGSTPATGQWTSLGGGTFSTNPADTPNITFTPPSNVSSVEVVWTTTDPAGPCDATSDTATVTINTSIGGFITPLDYTTCGTEPIPVGVTSLVDGVWATSPANQGTFSPSDENATTFTPNAGFNSINIVWTSLDSDGPGGCPPLVLDTTVQVFGPVTAFITSVASVCDNDDLQLVVTSNATTGIWSTAEGTGTIADADENSTTYTPSQTDYLQSSIEFFFIVPDPDGDGPCEGVSDSFEVVVNQAPTANAGENDTLCSGSTLPILVGLPAGGTWSGSAQPNGQFQPSGNGLGAFENYYTFTDSEGCIDVDTVVVNVFPTATAGAGGPYPICGVQPVVLNAVTNGTGQWTGGLGTYSLNTSTNATYTPAVSEIGLLVPITWTTADPDGINGPCTAASATTVVAISEPATFDPTTPITICSSDTADLSVNTSPTTGTWSGGTGSFLNPNSPTTFYIPAIADVGNIVLTWETTDPDDVAPDSIGPCPSVDVDQIVFVLDAATADAGSDIYSCGLDSIALDATANGMGEWSGGLGSFNNSSQTETYYHPDPSEVGQTFELYWTTFDPDLTATGNGPCTGDIDTVVVQINEPAFAEIDAIDAICSNGDAELSVTSYPAQGTWEGGAGQYASDSQLTTTYTPADSETAIVIPITWTTIDPDGTGLDGPCQPYVDSSEIQILAQAIADITEAFSVCANGTIDINVEENGDGQWTVEPASAGTFADAFLSSTQFTPSVDYYTAQTFDITWMTFDPDGDGPCASAEDDTTVSILPLPQINMAESFAIPCGDDISATVSTYQNATYTFVWSPTNGLIEPDQLITPVIQDNQYILQVTDANQCTNADTTLVDAIALADMASAADAATCLYVPIELSGFGANGEDPFSYAWELTEEVSESAINDSLANFVFDDYILQDSVLEVVFFVTDIFGCTDEDTINVTVFALPAIDPGQNWNLCEDSPAFTLTNFSPQPASGISGIWTPGSGVNPAQMGVNSVTYTYTFTDNNGCVNDSSMVVSINEVPEPMMVVPSVACVDTPLPLENNSSCGTCSDVNYQWYFGIANSTSTEFEPSFVYSVNDIGLQTVQLIAVSGFGCDDTTQAIVDIVLPPIPLFEATYNQPSCAPLAVDISNDTDTAGLYLSYEWTIENVGVYNTFLPPPLVLQQGDSILDYTIQLMVENVCGQYYTDTIVSVLPQPVADILTSTVYGCTPLVVDFINESVGLPDAIEWDFGDETFSGMDTPPSHTFYTDSTITIYNLTVALENECGVDTFFQDITVLPNTVTALFTTSTASGCTPLEVTFTDFSTGASQLNFTLCNGVTNSGETFTYTFTEPGSCEVQLVADNGCSFDTTTVPIFVVQSPEPEIVADFSSCANESIEFAADNVQNAMLTWNFDDASLPATGNPIQHVYTDAGDYLVELLAENNLFGVQCSGTATLPIHISPNPEANFAIPTSYGCSPFQLCFENLSGTSDPNMMLSYQWNFDGLNGDTDFAPCYTYYNQSGELVYYTVTLQVTASDIQYMQTCTTETSQNILVQPQPISGFDMESDYTCYYPFQLNALNTTVGGGSYQWQFNGNDWGQLTNGTFLIENLGAYAIDLIAMNQFGCTDTASQVFNSFPLPTLDFTFDVNDGCAPLMVQFENLSTGNNSYVWNMGDNTQANVQDIVHQFNYPGSYNVMLIGTTENNCTDTLVIEDPIRVYPVPVANFIFAPEEVNILNPQMTFEETGFGGSYFHWDFNDGSEDYGAIVDHSFNTPYYHAVTLTAYNQYGCTDDITKNVYVTDYLTVYVPNTFTPDDDNINDVFKPEMGGKEMIDSYRFWITDRWGNVIFETNDFDTPWTGNVRGGDHYVSPDAYIWSVQVQLKNGEEREYTGHVVLVR